MALKKFEGTMTSKNEINVEEHMGLVHLCAKRFSGKGIDYDDIFQAGSMGLVKAAAHFDETLGNKFSTYAVPVILGEIKGLFRTGSAIKISRDIWELSRKIQHECDKMREENGEFPTMSALSQKLNVNIEKIALAFGALKTPLSLSAGDENEELQIPQEAPEEKMTDRLTLQQIIKDLPQADKKLLQLRYFQNKTQKETAEYLGMTQVQISRREKKILLYMRSLMLH